MDCGDVRAALLRDEVPQGAAAAAHLSTCSACTMLVGSPGLVRVLGDEGRAGPDPGLDLDRLLSRTLSAVDGERGLAAKLRALATSVRIGLGLLVAVLVVLVVVVATPRADLEVVPPGRFALDVLLYALPALAALAVALWPLQRTVSRHTRGLVALACVLAAACVASLPPLHTLHPASLVGEGEFAQRAVACFAFGTLAALPTFVILRLLAREGPRVDTKAVVLALAAALFGSAALFLHCPITHPGHLWAGHVAVLWPAAIWALWHGRGRL